MNNINLIVAVSDNMVIGKGDELPWNIPTDLKSFKKITDGAAVIMGRKCWDSIPEKFRPLPKRFNIVVTRDKAFTSKGAIVVHDLDEVLTCMKNTNIPVFVIGGAEIYKQAISYVDNLYVTRVIGDIEGDVFLEGLKFEDWVETFKSDVLEENGFKFQFHEYKKNS